MGENINILILSCGTRNKIVQYFKKELEGKGLVIATDCSSLAPALYDADKHFIVPRMDSDGYLEHILSICKTENIKAILSLIDPEISLLSKYKDKFLEMGCLPITSDYETVEMCFDKYKMYNFLVENNFKTARSYVNKEEFYQDVQNGIIDFPVFVKPSKGSASLNINKVTTKEEIDALFSRYDNLLIQEFMNGQEYGIDVYIDMITNEPIEVFIKEKIKMRAGETDKSVSVKNDRLLKLIKKFIEIGKFKGIIDIDVFKVGNDFYISEVNPRFGGGYPHAFECGVDVPNMIIENVDGKVNNPRIGNYKSDIYMVKYSELKII